MSFQMTPSKPTLPPTHQTDALLDQAAPAQNTWYDILPPTDNVRLYSVSVGVAVADETLEVAIVADGVTYAVGFAATAGTDYQIGIDTWGSTTAYSVLRTIAAYNTIFSYTFFEGRNVQVKARKTTAAGAGNLTGRAVYAKW